jgi:hypothetical protein
MNIKLSFKFIVSFIALTFVMHEAHEIVHTTIGRIICGCWGQRDFNVWGLCEGCIEKTPIALIATFAGPVFTFIMIWIGTSLLKSTNTKEQRSFGFALVFANMPFARILTASLGGGDEVSASNQLLNNHSLAWVIGLSSILLIVGYPLYKAFITIDNKRRIGFYLLFLLTPIVIDMLVVLGLLNRLLENGVLANYWILGSPVLVTAWTMFVVITFILTRRYIYTLARSDK